jgi:hypothetical protein
MRSVLYAGVASMALLGLVACDNGPTDPTGDPVNLSYAGCVGASDNPSWFAYQDGNGPWHPVTASASGAFDFTLRGGKGGIATYSADGGLYIVYATTAEFQANLPSCSGSVRTVSSTVSGYSQADDATLYIGSGREGISGTTSAPAAIVVAGVEPTASDLIGVRARSASGATAVFEIFPTSVFIRRNVSGATTPLVDFNSATEAGAPVQRTVAITNIGAGEAPFVRSFVALQSTVGNIARFEGVTSVSSGSATVPFYGVPAARLQPNDTQMILVGATKSVSASTIEARYASSLFSDPADKSLTLGPALGTVTVTGTSRPTATYTVQTGYNKAFDVIFEQGSGTSNRVIEVVASSAYLGSPASVTLSVPNLTAVTGFSASWLLTPGASTTWDFLATSADFSILSGKPLAYAAAERQGTFTP